MKKGLKIEIHILIMATFAEKWKKCCDFVQKTSITYGKMHC